MKFCSRIQLGSETLTSSPNRRISKIRPVPETGRGRPAYEQGFKHRDEATIAGLCLLLHKEEVKTRMNCAIELRMMKNLATETEILNPSQAPLEASEYSQRSFTVEIPIEKLMTDQLVSLSGVIRLQAQTLPFVATGKIISALSLGNGSVKAEIYLHQFDKNLWNQFLQAKDQVQNQADQLFKKIKGEI